MDSISDSIIRYCVETLETKEKCLDCSISCSENCADCLDYTEERVPDYSCRYRRCAYVLRYFFVFKEETRRLLEVCSNEIISHLDLRDRNTMIDCTGMGAGPGSEFVGFLEWMMDNHITDKRVRFRRVDKLDDWNEQYFKIMGFYKGLLDERQIELKCVKIIKNMFDVNFINKKLDVVYFSNVLSEHIKRNDLNRAKQLVDRLWSNMCSSMAERAIIILNDRPQEEVGQIFDYFFSLVCGAYPKTSCYDYSFNGNYGMQHNCNPWCGQHFDDDIREKYKIMLKCRSYQSIIFVQR